ncbi:hypothetical protein BH18GEM1_BH18GEM1_06750 [soil metagenome]
MGNAGPDVQSLWKLAARQVGYFTTAEARECGFRRALLSYHVRREWILRVRRGIYRIRDYPLSPHEELRIEWMAAGRDHAVLSHESALHLQGFLDENPWTIHITIGRSRRWYDGPQPRVRVHTRQEEYRDTEIVLHDGMRLTAPEVSIVESVEFGILTADLFTAVARALARKEATPESLMERARRSRVRRVERFVRLAIDATRPVSPPLRCPSPPSPSGTRARPSAA